MCVVCNHVCNLVLLFKSQLTLEARKGRYTHIVCPRKTQLPAQQRRIRLQTAGILNVNNCRRLVRDNRPCDTDQRWAFVKRENLVDMGKHKKYQHMNTIHRARHLTPHRASRHTAQRSVRACRLTRMMILIHLVAVYDIY